MMTRWLTWAGKGSTKLPAPSVARTTCRPGCPTGAFSCVANVPSAATVTVARLLVGWPALSR